MLEEQRKTAEVRKFLTEVYNQVGNSPVELKSLSDEEVLDLANNLRNGLPFATPAFDGAQEDEIKAMLELAGLPAAVRLRCTMAVPVMPLIVLSQWVTCIC